MNRDSWFLVWPVVCRQEGCKAAAVRGSKLGAESVAASGVSSEMVLNTVEECEAISIWPPHVLKSGELFR